MADKTAYQRTVLIGGGLDALDAIDGDDLLDGDFAFVMLNGMHLAYWLNATSGAAESVPFIISPDANPGLKRWILQSPSGVVYPEWFATTQAALDSIALTGGKVKFGEGTYLVALEVASNIILEGVGKKSILKLPDSSADKEIITNSDHVGGNSHIEIRNLAFDMNTANQAAVAYPATHHGIWLEDTTHSKIENCWFYNTHEHSIYLHDSSKIWIKRNHFTGTTTSNLEVGHINAVTCDDLIVKANILDNPAPVSAAVGLHGMYFSGIDNVVIEGNLLNYCGRDNTGGHRLGAIDLYTDHSNSYVQGNILTNCNHRGIRISSTSDNIMVSKNYIEATSHEGILVYGTVAGVTKNITVTGNIISSKTTADAAINLVGENDVDGELLNIIISDNNILDGYYGILGAHMKDVIISGNKIHCRAIGISLSEGATAKMDDAVIDGNIIDHVDAGNTDAIYFDGDRVSITNNILRDTYNGIQTKINTSGIITNNTIEATNMWIYKRNTGNDVLIDGNRFLGTPTTPFSLAADTKFTNNNVGADETVTVAAPALNVWGYSFIDSASNDVAATLADGQYPGQIKTIVLTDATEAADGGTTVTVAHHEDGDAGAYTFKAVDDICVFMWKGTEWYTMHSDLTA